MKKNLLLLGMLVFAVSPAFATVDVDTITDPYFLRNQNYSYESIRLIQLSKNYANGTPVEIRNNHKNKAGEVVDAVFKYIDPAWDDGKFFVREMPQQFGFEDI